MKHIVLPILALCGLMASPQAGAQGTDRKNPLYAFVPKGYVITSEHKVGDPNQDGIYDKVLIVRNTLKSKINKETQEDNNRGGMIILFGTNNNGYRKAAENLDCFSPKAMEEDRKENLYVNIELENNRLVFGFNNYPFGFCEFVLRYQDDRFKLIGYMSKNMRDIFTLKETSINTLTGKKRELTNILTEEEIRKSYDADPDNYKDEFTEKWTTLGRKPLIDFTDIKNYDELDWPGSMESLIRNAAFLPKGFAIKSEHEVGDLNKDGLRDKVLIVKKVQPKETGIDENTGKPVYENSEGMIVLFATKGGGYTKAAENLNGFDAEKASRYPNHLAELYVYEQEPSCLKFGYIVEAEGEWTYTFRYQNGGFKLIGYDYSNSKYVNRTDISINFLTCKKQERYCTAEWDEGIEDYKEKTDERWTKIKRKPLLDFTEIEDYHNSFAIDD
ncbi:MAG: hypothetical protein HUK08_09380 [Bacteroidaceae bacterium]|nr:hypothetical protein [Bacteroidaceae bacterium]